MMNFKAVWGFDPEEALRVQNAFRMFHASADDAAGDMDLESQDRLRIPRGRDSQIRELQRMFRL
jgi:hypothetical protein